MSRPPKNIITTKANDTKRSILVVPSKVCSNAEEPELEGVEETEIAAQITVPEEGGWGWLVVAASFFCIFVLDGVYFTFGSIFHDMAHDLAVEESLVALINSIAVAVYFVGGPFVSALINRFGFRACTMSGSIIGSIALLCLINNRRLHSSSFYFQLPPFQIWRVAPHLTTDNTNIYNHM